MLFKVYIYLNDCGGTGVKIYMNYTRKQIKKRVAGENIDDFWYSSSKIIDF